MFSITAYDSATQETFTIVAEEAYAQSMFYVYMTERKRRKEIRVSSAQIAQHEAMRQAKVSENRADRPRNTADDPAPSGLYSFDSTLGMSGRSI